MAYFLFFHPICTSERIIPFSYTILYIKSQNENRIIRKIYNIYHEISPHIKKPAIMLVVNHDEIKRPPFT